MKVLVIEDNLLSVKGIVDYCKEKNWECMVSGFESAYEYLVSLNPDTIVLDWRGDADEIDKGSTVLDLIWCLTFRPVVVYSAYEKLIELDDKYKSTGMITLIQKGDERPVCQFLSENEDLSLSLSEFRTNIGTALLQSLKSIDFIKNSPLIDLATVNYILAKRVSSYFDDKFAREISPSWAQYVYPPVNTDLLVCDIIRKKASEETRKRIGNPCDYRIILTPSCDMASGEGRYPVNQVLCAKCTGKEVFYQNCIQNVEEDKQAEVVIRYLHQGYNGKFVAFPQLSNVIPYMTVNLKKTELVERDVIATEESQIQDTTQYYRVASIASPFREQIVWAHMLNSCRPGVPDRNMEQWAKDILTV